VCGPQPRRRDHRGRRSRNVPATPPGHKHAPGSRELRAVGTVAAAWRRQPTPAIFCSPAILDRHCRSRPIAIPSPVATPTRLSSSTASTLWIFHPAPRSTRTRRHARLWRSDRRNVVNADEHAVAGDVVGKSRTVAAGQDRPALNVIALAVVQHQVVLRSTAPSDVAVVPIECA